MVAFGNIVIANEVFLITILAPIIFIAWYYTRILKSQSVKVLFEDSSGTSWVYSALWSPKQNKITMVKSRKEKIIIKKQHDYKLINFNSISRQLWFRVMEGKNQTVSWSRGDKIGKAEKSEVDLGYEAVGLLQSLIDSVKSAAMMSFKNPMILITTLGGIGIGVGIGFIIANLFG